MHVAVDYAMRYAAERKDAPKLVLIGQGTYEPPEEAEGVVVHAGFVSEDEKRAAYAEALALVNPSHMESLSIVLMEAWLEGTPALVDDGLGRAPRARRALRRRAALRLLRELPRRARPAARRAGDPRAARRGRARVRPRRVRLARRPRRASAKLSRASHDRGPPASPGGLAQRRGHGPGLRLARPAPRMGPRRPDRGRARAPGRLDRGPPARQGPARS